MGFCAARVRLNNRVARTHSVCGALTSFQILSERNRLKACEALYMIEPICLK